MKITRRNFTAVVAGAIATPLMQVRPAGAAEKVVRIGYQKYGTLVLLKGKGLLEKKLKSIDYTVEWTEFPGGPQLLEALNAGAVDFGSTGETPPIFAQAADAPLVYIAHEPPAPRGEAILVAKDSPIKAVADLKGKKVAFNKGSNVHYLLVKALEEAGLTYEDVESSFLAPADGRAAFEKGAVDAWVIWDPFQAAAEVAIEARELRNGEGIVPNHQFYLGTTSLVDGHAQAIDVLIDAISEIDEWTKSDTAAAAAELSPSVGIPEPVLVKALERQSYGIKSLDDAVVAQQQGIADTFFELKLIPKKVTIADVVRKGKA
ncbi:sulfonate ABC transporter substrate-binding protein (plasmid) [Rhizobium leguminosarum]|uniref:sulfonate ABC transporter substrate-binding protein n=1 Tax=Rhizobium leguminosarum TaxID=384 RepID=UPI000DE3AFE4|nr:sulfonate ABC transporter substrate-binding protein [Rhizobium leguminosarum]MDH6660562.1 sulfonate transport system substrate-binding protein [Rhizobium sophorae]MBB4523482.1 sulfonate transport system substrate-binding protein [Rhizobium leguminosarum]TBZ41391.1 sulfonate ABC transporter substrate-binding protein [Rhizobium leguminosarum bv. viciae]TCA09458.1 sulfonate ABC transporter substrate-binding protein [Rhizobium leguminosarum bv. viciae]TCA18828.1 sulfonate ABC transporter substr